MTGIEGRSGLFNILKQEAADYDEYIIQTYNIISKELNLETRSLGGGSFDFAQALAFRFIKDEEGMFLDRSIEIRIDRNNNLYLVCILGSLKLKKLSSAKELQDIITKLSIFNFEKHSDRTYIATVDALGKTLPPRADYTNSENISTIINNLPLKIFNKQDIPYNLSKNLRKNITLEFHSEVYQAPENDKKQEAETSSMDNDNNSNTGTEAEILVNDDNSGETEDASITETPTNDNNKITIELTPNREDQITSAENIIIPSQEEPSDDSSHYTAIASPPQTTSWSDWTYENSYYIIGGVITAASLYVGKSFFFSSIAFNSPKYGEPLAQLATSREISVHDFSSPSIVHMSPYSSPGGGTVSIFDIYSPTRTGKKTTFAFDTAIKAIHRLSTSSRDLLIEDAADAILETYTNLDVSKYGSSTVSWLEGEGKEDYFKENFLAITKELTLKNSIKNSFNLCQLWRDGFRNPSTHNFEDNISSTGRLMKKGFKTIFEENKGTAEKVIKALKIPLDDTNKCNELNMDATTIHTMLKNAEDNAYILYIIIMGLIIENNIVAAEDAALFSNNNVTDWDYFASNIDFNDEESDGNNTDHSTHPLLTVKHVLQAIEENHKTYTTLEFSSLSDSNMKCRFALKKTISDTADALEFINIVSKGFSGTKDIFSLSTINQFIIVPYILSSESTIDTVVDNFCDAAENGYELALQFLGIEDSSEVINS